jgi:hypothetical protein
MSYLCLFGLTFALFLQISRTLPASENIFLPNEKSQLEKAQNVDQRIKVYDAASKRLQQELEAAVDKEEFIKVPDKLRLWVSALTKSLEDIDANLKAKKKPRALINYEIQLRKSITRTESLKIRAPVDQQDVFDSSLAEAEKVRKQFVEILFRH